MLKITINQQLIREITRAALKKEALPIVQQTASKIVEELKEETPVDTGFARDSWEIEFSFEKTATIVNKAEYIQQLNDGSSSQAPAHFVENTVLKYAKPKGPIVTYE